MQIVGAFLLQMVMGSILSITSCLLDWSILNQKLNTFLSTSYLVIILNIAMLLRLFINKYMDRQRQLGLQIIALFTYMLSLFMMEILPEKLLFIFPMIYVFFIGLIILDPLDQLLIEDPLQFEKYICLFFCSLFSGWIGFGLIQSIIIKEECQKRCYFIYPTLISVITIIGFYLYYPRYSTLDEEFDSRNNFKDDQINRDIIHNTFIIQEKNILKDENFYLVMYKFAMLFTPAIGSMDYIIQKNDNLFSAWLVMGLSTIFGSLITMLLKQPYKFNTIIVIAQLGMMIAINLLGVVHQNYQLIVLALQFLLFGFICCFNVLILQNTYDNVIENIPIAFIALSITTMAQYLLFYFLDNKKLIQSIEFTLIVISYLSNWLII